MTLKKKRKNKKERINFKYNLKNYFKFLKKYKPLFFWLLFIILITETLLVVDKFLFKRIIDDGTLFIDGSLGKEIFIATLIIIAMIFLGVVIARTFTKWFTIHLVSEAP